MRSFFLDSAQRISGRFDSDGRSCAAGHAQNVFVLTTMQVEEGGDVRRRSRTRERRHMCLYISWPCLESHEDRSHGQFDVTHERKKGNMFMIGWTSAGVHVWFIFSIYDAVATELMIWWLVSCRFFGGRLVVSTYSPNHCLIDQVMESDLGKLLRCFCFGQASLRNQNWEICVNKSALHKFPCDPCFDKNGLELLFLAESVLRILRNKKGLG